MKLKALAKRTAAATLTLAAVALAAAPVLAAPAVDVSPNNAVADHAGILSDDTINYINSVSAELSDACGAQIGVYTLDELLGNTTMEGYAYDVFNEWGLGSADKDNGVLLLLAPYEADGGDYFIMRGAGLESQLSISTLSTMTDEYLEPSWAQGNYDAGTRKTVEALTKRLCSIYGVSLDDGYTTTTTRTERSNITTFILILFAVILVLALLRPRRRRRPRHMPPPPPPPPYGGGYGGPRYGGGPRPGGFGGSRPPRPPRPPRPSGGFRSGGGSSRGSGIGRSSRPSGGSRSGSFHAGGGTTRGGGVGRHH